MRNNIFVVVEPLSIPTKTSAVSCDIFTCGISIIERFCFQCSNSALSANKGSRREVVIFSEVFCKDSNNSESIISEASFAHKAAPHAGKYSPCSGNIKSDCGSAKTEKNAFCKAGINVSGPPTHMILGAISMPRARELIVCKAIE